MGFQEGSDYMQSDSGSIPRRITTGSTTGVRRRKALGTAIGTTGLPPRNLEQMDVLRKQVVKQECCGSFGFICDIILDHFFVGRVVNLVINDDFNNKTFFFFIIRA